MYSGGRYGPGNVEAEIKALSCDLDITDVQGDSFCASRLPCDPLDFVFNAGRVGFVLLGGHTAAANSINYIMTLQSTKVADALAASTQSQPSRRQLSSVLIVGGVLG